MNKFTEVTWFSKIATLIVFLCAIPTLAFYIGTQYEQTRALNNVTVNPEQSDVTKTATLVLEAIKNKNYEALENLTSTSGLSLSFTPNLDLSKNNVSKDEVSNIPNNTNVYLFGYSDGKGDPINLTVYQFINEMIYTNDYQKADEIAINKIVDKGTNSINTLIKDIGSRTLVAFHFKGFNPEYTGMDWTTLYLVFDLENGSYKLRGIAKNNWTI